MSSSFMDRIWETCAAAEPSPWGVMHLEHKQPQALPAHQQHAHRSWRTGACPRRRPRGRGWLAAGSGSCPGASAGLPQLGSGARARTFGSTCTCDASAPADRGKIPPTGSPSRRKRSPEGSRRPSSSPRTHFCVMWGGPIGAKAGSPDAAPTHGRRREHQTALCSSRCHGAVRPRVDCAIRCGRRSRSPCGAVVSQHNCVME